MHTNVFRLNLVLNSEHPLGSSCAFLPTIQLHSNLVITTSGYTTSRLQRQTLCGTN